MKVTVSDHVYQPKIMELEKALEPMINTYGESIGVVEEASQQSELNAECIGRLLAWLVESKRMDIRTAKDIAAIRHDIEVYVKPFPSEVAMEHSKWEQTAPKGD